MFFRTAKLADSTKRSGKKVAPAVFIQIKKTAAKQIHSSNTSKMDSDNIGVEMSDVDIGEFHLSSAPMNMDEIQKPTTEYKTPGTKERPPIQLEWKDVKFQVKQRVRLPDDAPKLAKLKSMFSKEQKVILHPMSGYVSPGSVLAIMGPSGAGKVSVSSVDQQQ